MKRLTRLCKDTQDGKFLPYTTYDYTGIYSNVALGKAVERLAYYENLEEEGRLIILSVNDIHPCKSCDIGWGSISSEGCESCHDDCERLKQYHQKYGY